MKIISKEKIKYINHLRNKKYREKFSKYVVEGEKIAIEYLKNLSNKIDMICATEEFYNKIDNSLISKIPEKYFISFEIMKKLSELSTPSSVLLVVNYEKFNLNIEHILETDLILMLDNIQDPGNLGTIIRTADWFGINYIICSPNSVDCYNQKVIQSSMGSLLRVNLYYTDLYGFLETVKTTDQKFNIYGTFLEGASIYEESLKLPAIIILGNESRGISNYLKESIDKKLFIPSFSNKRNKPNSLNVAIATAIVLSEFRRRNP